MGHLKEEQSKVKQPLEDILRVASCDTAGTVSGPVFSLMGPGA